MILSVSVKLSVFVVVVCFVCVCVCVCVCVGTKLIKSHNNVSCPDYLCHCFLFLFCSVWGFLREDIDKYQNVKSSDQNADSSTLQSSTWLRVFLDALSETRPQQW